MKKTIEGGVFIPAQDLPGARVLPKVSAKGKTYIIDARLKEMRNEKDIMDKITWDHINSFDDDDEFDNWLDKMGWSSATFADVYVALSQ